MKRKKKPKYKIGVIRSGTDAIAIKKIYPPGHWAASKTQKETQYITGSKSVITFGLKMKT